MTDLIDKYQPTALHGWPFAVEDYGLKVVSHLYNVSAQLHGGKTESIYTSKDNTDCAVGTCLLDHERGVSDGIAKNPWQTDTCIGQWHYKRGEKYKTPKKVIDLLTDHCQQERQPAVELPLPNSRRTRFRRDDCIEWHHEWMAVNSEGIYSSRPWKIYGEGPSTKVKIVEGNFNEDKQNDLTAEDIRFTTKDSMLYVFVMGCRRRLPW